MGGKAQDRGDIQRSDREVSGVDVWKGGQGLKATVGHY